jgi:hypothetical protein
MVAALVGTAFAQEAEPYPGWTHSGSFYLLTTPEGANLPATASVENFPILVRLHRDFFDFGRAKPGGEDVRFSAGGKPLACQVEEWDAAQGTASVWVRVPSIQGNSRQEIRMHWGRPDAAGESSGSAVFNESNGYLSVWHMGDPVKDEVGTLESKDSGTAPAPGIIGRCRRFDFGKGISAGEKITAYPTGSSPHTSEAWVRAEKPNAAVLGWGNEQAQGKVVMQLASPPHIRMDCYFSGGDVRSMGRLPMSEWVHVVHTYRSGESKVYVNGVLEGVNTSTGGPLAIKSPARMDVGGWHNQYRFVGDIDEVRISKVTRSADWIRLQYENQKPLQTLVGPLVRPGDAFSVSTRSLTIPEGGSAPVSAETAGAQKIYWILKSGDRESIVAVDRSKYTLEAGRVTGNQSLTLRLKAVHARETRTLDLPVTIREEIPDPVFTLKAPAAWDGRETIEVVPRVSNLAEMEAKGAGRLNCSWTVSDIAVIQEILPGKLVLKRAQNSGDLTVTAALDNGGARTVRSITIRVREPAKDAWVHRTPAKDEKPEEGQFYARDDGNEGTLHYNGTLDEAGEEVFLRLYADGRPIQTETARPGQDRAYALSVKLKPGLVKYKVDFGLRVGGAERVLNTVGNLVCGDAYLIDGQSNALATDTREDSPPETHEWIRSYGRPAGNAKDVASNLWCNPVWKARKGEMAELGWWGMELAKRLVESRKIPIFIINGAVGGTRIDQHQRNPADPTDLTTIYGRMLWRVRQARLTHGIRAILWHQGENDQGADGPTGGCGWETYQRFFVEMSAGWKQDFPNVKSYYVFQIWPNACSMGGKNGSGDLLREQQRTLPRLYSNLSLMSTLGIRPPGPCHYPLAGWAEFARLIQPLIERDHYGVVPAGPITPPDLRGARYVEGTKDAIALDFDQPVVWTDALAGQFYLDGDKGKVASGSVSGNVLTLRLKEASAAGKITYLKEAAWSQDTLLLGANGIAALTFCDVPLRGRRQDRLGQEEAPKAATTYRTRFVEGWTVRIHPDLLDQEKPATEKALKLLGEQLQEIVRVVPGPAVANLREVTLWFSPPYPGVRPTAEYHPDRNWLVRNRRNPEMAKGVEFTDTRDFEAETRRMPNFTLHELAHGYHDRVLGFGHAEIKAAYDRAKAGGTYDAVERWHGNGQPNTTERAYAMTSPQEYFAESTEAFFVRNDFFPFTREELVKHDPEMEKLLARLWVTPRPSSLKPPPPELKAPAFYTKYVDAEGYPIVASANVDDYALKEAAYLVNLMLARRPDVRAAMVKSGSRLCIIAHNEFTTDLPEWSRMKPKDYWDARARGTGGSRSDPYCSCGEENLLGFPGDPYAAENILIHEFAHNIHLRGMVNVDATFDGRVKATYDAAMKAGLWKGKYAGVNHHEYFAEGVQSWFDNNRKNDHDHNHVDTRALLLDYDPGLAALCREVFGDTELKYTKPATRLRDHLAGYDPASAPKFSWPARLDQTRADIRKAAEERSRAATGTPPAEK